MSKLTKMQEELFQFVDKAHDGQTRKYTGERYSSHPLAVALSLPDDDFLREVALCHDLYEDTTVRFDELYKVLTGIGYEDRDSYDICTFVTELTDQYTHNDYPYFNREERKSREAARLGKCSSLAQTVKCADFIDNTKSIIENDPNFARVYLLEKNMALMMMQRADVEIWQKAFDLLGDSLIKVMRK